MDDRNIIGGLFGLHVPEQGKAFAFGSNCRYYVNARSAMWAVFKALGPKTIWLPSYLCPTMVDATVNSGISHQFYPVDAQLTVEDTGWAENVKAGDVVVAIDYFGFPSGESIFSATKKNGAYLVEDASQALLTDKVGERADYVIYSPRKFLGLTDGGIVSYGNTVPPISEPLLPPPPTWWAKAFKALVLRRQWDDGCLGVAQQEWFSEAQNATRAMPCGSYSTSTLASSMLATDSIDWECLRQERRDNYSCLLERFADVALFDCLPSSVVPLGFPIRVPSADRDDILGYLYSEKIYPPVHWRIEHCVPKAFADSHRLSSQEITLPCDQRYSTNEMKWMADRVRGKLKHLPPSALDRHGFPI